MLEAKKGEVSGSIVPLLHRRRQGAQAGQATFEGETRNAF
jgi:hypothetical protein